MNQGELVVRALDATDDLEPEYDLRLRSFGPISGALRELIATDQNECVSESRLFGVWEDGLLVGSARFYEMRQWWHGRSQPAAGVGGVKVAPEARGRGVGKALMTGMLAAMTERGFPLAVLYPATPHLYRSLGWELAGCQYLAELPGRALGSLRSVDPHLAAPGYGSDGAEQASQVSHVTAFRRAGPDDADQVIATLGAVHAGSRDCGPCTDDPVSVRSWLADPEVFAYLAADGFLAYGWHGSAHDIQVHVLQAASAQTARAFWGLVGSNASMAERVRAYVGPADPLLWLVSDLDVSVRRFHDWMLRVLDVRAAIAARGFPVGAQLRIALRLTDPQLPANAGLYTLTVGEGRGSLLDGVTDPASHSPSVPPVTVGPRGFAALFAGVPMATLRVAGLAAGGDAGTDAALDGTFAAQPYLLYYF